MKKFTNYSSIPNIYVSSIYLQHFRTIDRFIITRLVAPQNVAYPRWSILEGHTQAPSNLWGSKIPMGIKDPNPEELYREYHRVEYSLQFFFLSKLPPPSEGVEIVSYVVDSTLMARDNGINNLCRRINNYLSILAEFFSNRNLKISPTKFSATLRNLTIKLKHLPKLWR